MDDILGRLYRQESRRVFSTLVRLLGSFDAAEDALHDAFFAASEQWPVQGVPDNPVAWLVSAGRFKAIDRIRRDRRFVSSEDAAEQVESVADEAFGWEHRWDERQAIEDDRLRLVFTCCHPARNWASLFATLCPRVSFLARPRTHTVGHYVELSIMNVMHRSQL
jgi:RNA polymerase sigma-70 factor (ECF subfamily)